MSNIRLDGIHTPDKRGGKAVAYQGRKKSKTSNMLILTDNRGTPLACSDPVEGNHNDAFGVSQHVSQKFFQSRNNTNIVI